MTTESAALAAAGAVAGAWTWHTYRTNGQEFAQVKAGEAVYNVVPEHAPLIAAAPHLLGTLRDVWVRLVENFEGDSEAEELQALIAGAIAKATTDGRGRAT